MKVFVAGATGVLGKRAVARLVAAGHEVTAVARSDEKAALVRSLGAAPATVDLFDPAAVKDAVAGHDAVCNLATHIPTAVRSAAPGAWNENERIRSEASRNLVDAALAAGAARYVQESITFPYVDAGDAWIDEDSPRETTKFIAAVDQAEANARRFTESGGTGVVLRFGMFHSADSHTTRDMIRAARTGVLGLPGAPGAYSSWISVDDAAAAVVAALGAPAGVYNVVDDEPITRAELAAALGDVLGRTVRTAPQVVTAVGGAKVAPLARSQRVSNARFKEATGWAPEVRSIRDALPALAGESGGGGSRLARVSLALLVPSAVTVGLWATLAPRSFYDSFPGWGRVWVAVDGPFNEHLVRDVGALNSALAVLLAVAVWKGGRALLAAAAGAALVAGVPHFAYHLSHLDLHGTGDQVAIAATLALTVILPVAALAGVGRGREPAAAR